MKISFLCLGNEATSEMAEAKDRIVMSFREVFGGAYVFTDYGSEKSFIKGLSDAVENDDIVVLATAPGLFPAFKSFVASAFSLKTRVSKNVQKLVQESHPDMDEESVNRNAMLPVDADAIISQDGVLSGYGIRAEEQILLVLPLDMSRIDFLMDDGVFPYLRDNLNFSQIVSSQLESAAKIDQIPVSAGISNDTGLRGEPEPDAVQERSGEAYSEAFIRSVINKMRRKNISVAMADTKTIDFMKKVTGNIGNTEDTVFYTDYFADKGDETSDEYAVLLAKGTFDSSDKSVGASLTKVYAKPKDDGTKEYYIYACISDGKTANEARVAADPGETPPQLIYKAIEVLFRMIGLWADTGYAMPQYAEESVVDEESAPVQAGAETPEEQPEDEAGEQMTAVSKKNRSVRTAAGIMIGLSFVLSTLVSVFVNNIYGLIS